MTSHPWLSPSAPVAAKVARVHASAALRELGRVELHWLGARAPAWAPLLAALPALLQKDSRAVLDAVARVDVLPVLRKLVEGRVDDARLERALVTLWLALAGHPGLASPLALPGPFRERVLDPRAPRVLALENARGFAATSSGPVVIGRSGRLSVDEFVVSELPTAGAMVIVDEQLAPPDAEVVARVRAAFAQVESVLPGGHLERVTIGSGDAALGEIRVGPNFTPSDLVASAQAAFVRAAASEPPMPGGFLVEAGRRLSAAEVLARASGNLLSLPLRDDRAAAAQSILDDLDELTVLADLSATAAELVTAIRAGTAGVAQSRRRALLVNVDPADFVYSFQFARSVERRCVERGLRVDRIATDPSWKRDLSDELGQPVPEPIAEGTETFVHAEDDPAVAAALRRLSARRYEVAVVNVWPQLFYDLVAAGVLDGPTLIWDRHLHDGLGNETRRRGVDPASLRQRPMRVWSLQGLSASGLHPDLVQAGLIDGSSQHWPMDAEFFCSDAIHQPDLLFAGGDSARDYPLLIEAIRDLPLAVHLVTRHIPPALPPQVRVDVRLPLWRFRDAMAAASITAIPLREGAGAAGLTVLTMAMALGVAVVSTESTWITQYAEHERDALLVPAGDVDGFRDSIVRLHRDRELRERLTANAHRRVAEICDLDDFTRKMFATA